MSEYVKQHDAAVITAVYDAYDTVKPICPQTALTFGYSTGIRVDWVLVTDDPGKLVEAEPGALSGWRIVAEPRPGIHPSVAAKRPKFLPWAYTNAPLTAWVDASYRITSPRFISDAGEFADPIAQFVHPWRDCLYDEAAFSQTLPKYTGLDLAGQVAEYRAAGMPEHWGLWAAGVIVRKQYNHRARWAWLGPEWLDQVNRWTFQDQVSQPYVLWKTGVRPAALPGDHISNPWLKYEGSARH